MKLNETTLADVLHTMAEDKADYAEVDEVVYDKNFGGFGVRDAKANVVFTFGEIAEDISLISLEVIGNIYENPGLLEGE